MYLGSNVSVWWAYTVCVYFPPKNSLVYNFGKSHSSGHNTAALLCPLLGRNSEAGVQYSSQFPNIVTTSVRFLHAKFHLNFIVHFSQIELNPILSRSQEKEQNSSELHRPTESFPLSLSSLVFQMGNIRLSL